MGKPLLLNPKFRISWTLFCLLIFVLLILFNIYFKEILHFLVCDDPSETLDPEIKEVKKIYNLAGIIFFNNILISSVLGFLIGLVGAFWEKYLIQNKHNFLKNCCGLSFKERLSWKFIKKSLLYNGWYILSYSIIMFICLYFKIAFVPAIIMSNIPLIIFIKTVKKMYNEI